jgi:hypothetical protein
MKQHSSFTMMDGYEGRDMCVLVMLKFRKLLNANGLRAVKEHSLFAMNMCGAVM